MSHRATEGGLFRHFQEAGEVSIRGFVQICSKSRIAIFQTALLSHKYFYTIMIDMLD